MQVDTSWSEQFINFIYAHTKRVRLSRRKTDEHYFMLAEIEAAREMKPFFEAMEKEIRASVHPSESVLH